LDEHRVGGFGFLAEAGQVERDVLVAGRADAFDELFAAFDGRGSSETGSSMRAI